MKKFICIPLLLVFCICSNAQDYDFIKMQTFDNSADKGLYRRNADQIGDDDMSGDIYVLRYNENTRVHTLYRIQNTWDPIWRNEWYSVHK